MPRVKCEICLKEFYVKPSHQKLGWGKYCSIKCRSKSQFKGQNVSCFICGKEIYRSPRMISRVKNGKWFCSKSCQTIWRNGVYVEEKSARFVNGESAYRRILIRSGKERVCLICKINNERVLSVHHVDHDRENNKIGNLVWLCFNCHFLVHHDKDLDRKITNFPPNSLVLLTTVSISCFVSLIPGITGINETPV